MPLAFHDVAKTFHAGRSPVQALAPCSFEVLDGEFVSLVGPSGCGKSTLLAIAAGLEPATGGEVRLDGRRVAGPGRDRGMIFQNYTLFPWLTVEENIRFSHELRANFDPRRPMGEILTQLEYAGHLMEIMGLSAFATRYPRELSGGMKQRAAIARALANKPRILLMDEPFGALDSQTREELQELMLLLNLHERATTLLVTHDIAEAIYLSDRVVMLSARPGRVLHEIPIPFPKDRQLDLKLTPEFLALERDLVHKLHAGGGRPSTTRADLLARLGKSFSRQPRLTTTP